MTTTRTPGRILQPDYLLVGTTLLLVLIGIVMVSSASVVLSYTEFGNNTHYLYHQLLGALIGVAAFAVFARIDYHRFRRLAPLALFITIGLLAAVVLTPLGSNHGTVAKRWLDLGPISFQPTELIKLTFVVYLAAWLEQKGEAIKSFNYGFLPFVLVLAVVAALVMKQPDMGTMSVVALSAAAMFFIAGGSWSHLGLGAASAALVVFALIKAAPYRLARLTIFLNPSQDQSGAGYHVNQALLAIGSGGLFGLGFGQSRQKYNYLPEPATDSIFAVIAEELGLIRASAIVALLVVVIWRGYMAARDAPDQFGRLLGVGIISWISFQAVVNIGAMLGVLPLTGVPLPFISYGSSSLILSLIAMGILTNISSYSRKERYASSSGRWWHRRTRLAGAGHRPGSPTARA